MHCTIIIETDELMIILLQLQKNNPMYSILNVVYDC